ncbi:MAG: T9SS type A sorting domain-containing protein [Bacteroidales bacterium]|nr:T9SS type A sorting domain-containing protein [Bacteroidales bacterium]
MKKTLLLFVFAIGITIIANAQPYNFDGLTVGSTGTFTNGWVGAPTSGFAWSADADGTGSGGTGPAVDHTLGTTLGIYMYTEASTPAVLGDSAILVSPNINLSTYSGPGLSFWYHMCGTSMGNLYIDVFNGTTWVRGVDSLIGPAQTAETDPWLNKIVNLSAFSGTIKVRFRAICGSGFMSDMAIDDVDIIEIPPYDLGIIDTKINPGIYMIPKEQAIGYEFNADIKNLGTDTIHNPVFKVTVGSWQDSVTSAEILPNNTLSLNIGSFIPATSGLYSAIYECYGTETDTTLSNNTDTIQFVVSDTVYSYNDSIATGALGIGAGTSGILGQKYEVFATDTLTSVSFYLNGPVVGDTTWISVHTFDTIPGAEFAVSDTLFIPSATGAWYTVNFECPVVLDSGTYFIGIHELYNNITIGTSVMNYQPETSWVVFATNPWQPSEFYGFNVLYLIRANFANYTPAIFAGTGINDTICEYDSPIDLYMLLTANDTGGVWIDNNSTGALTGSIFDPSTAGLGSYTFTYSVSDSCGIADETEITIVVDECLGIEESNDNRIQVYPNPSNGLITVELSKLSNNNNSLEITNSIGQNVFVLKNIEQGSTNIDLSFLPAGIYYLSIHTESEIISKKLILK